MYYVRHSIDRPRRTTNSTTHSVTDEENFGDETEQTFNQVSSLRTRTRRRCRLCRLSTEVWRWPLADGLNMDDPANRVSVADKEPGYGHRPICVEISVYFLRPRGTYSV